MESVLVSWASLFWGLLAVALNSMSQPSGKVCDSPANIGFMLHSSPMICIFDVLVMLARLAYHSISRRSVREASQVVIIQRFAFDDEDSGTFSEFRKNAIVRWFLFAAMMGQAVKLFGLEGIIWTKVWALMYIVSFLILESLVVIPSREIDVSKADKSLHNIKGYGATSMPYISVATAVVFLLWFTVRASTSISNANGLRRDALQWTGPIILCFGVSPFALASLYVARVKDRVERQRMRASYYLWLLCIIVIPVCYLLSMLFGERINLKDTYMNVFTTSMSGLWVLCALRWASTTFSYFAKSRKFQKPIEVALSWYFLSLHLVSAVLYYIYVYDPQETNKPGWTENLG